MVDSHCHLDFPDYKDDFVEVLERTKSALDFVVNIGTDVATSERVVKLAQEHDFIFGAVGIHPDEASKITVNDLETLNELARHHKVVAMGECGLDYAPGKNISGAIKGKQLEVLQHQLEIARGHNLPVVFHCRDAYEDLADFLETQRAVKGVMHCYVGSLELARRFLSQGLYLSFTGIITFKNAGQELLEVVKTVPLDKILIETDAPFLSPVPYRGKRNEPIYVVEVAKKIAEIKGISIVECDKQTTQNAKLLFNIN